MNKLTLPKWWEALILLLPIVGSIVSTLILLFLPIGVMLAYYKGNSVRIVRNWPLIQGILLLSPVLSTVSLIGASYLHMTPPIGSNILVAIATMWMGAYMIVGIVYNKAIVEVREISAYFKK